MRSRLWAIILTIQLVSSSGEHLWLGVFWGGVIRKERGIVTNRIAVELLAPRMEGREVNGRVAIVVDVLRATTTIAQALHAGARGVFPCLTVEQARLVAARLKEEPLGQTNEKADIPAKSASGRGAIPTERAPSRPVLLGGERGGKRIDGFDLGNSPADYSPERVAGASIVFTTTNGTAAMSRCAAARRILLGAFVNLGAIADRLVELASDVVVVCAGTGGEVTREDVLFAGALVDRLLAAGGAFQAGDDSAVIVLDAWRNVKTRTTTQSLASVLHESRGGRNLNRIGLGRDVDGAARIDAAPVVPELDWKARTITCAD